MSETQQDPPAEQDPETEQVDSTDTTTDDGDDDVEAMRKALKRANREAKDYRLKAKRADELEAELEQLRGQQMSDQEKAIEEARKEARVEAMSEVNARIARSEAKALATGKTRDPEVAVQLLGDLTQYVTNDGDVDTDAMSDALDKLVEEKEYLAVGDRQPVPDADQGARGGASVKQVTREQLKTMTPAEIDQADREGRLDALKAGKTS